MNRFEGIRRLYGAEADRLSAAHVLVVGLGGVGSWAVEALARSGVGALTLMDGDDVCVTNTNRQLHATAATIGQAKAGVMAERARAINPDCRVAVLAEFFQSRAPERAFPEAYDFVIDAVDGVTAKATLIGASRARGIPVITCGAAGGKVQPGLVQVADLALAHHDRLLMFVRKKLRKHYDVPGRGNRKMGIPCVFSPEPVRMPVACGDAAGEAFPADDAPLTCEGRLGSAVFVTGVFGLHAAAWVVNALADRANR